MCMLTPCLLNDWTYISISQNAVMLLMTHVINNIGSSCNTVILVLKSSLVLFPIHFEMMKKINCHQVLKLRVLIMQHLF